MGTPRRRKNETSRTNSISKRATNYKNGDKCRAENFAAGDDAASPVATVRSNDEKEQTKKLRINRHTSLTQKKFYRLLGRFCINALDKSFAAFKIAKYKNLTNGTCKTSYCR